MVLPKAHKQPANLRIITELSASLGILSSTIPDKFIDLLICGGSDIG